MFVKQAILMHPHSDVVPAEKHLSRCLEHLISVDMPLAHSALFNYSCNGRSVWRQQQQSEALR